MNEIGLIEQLRCITDPFGRLELLGFMIKKGALKGLFLPRIITGSILGPDTSALTVSELTIRYFRTWSTGDCKTSTQLLLNGYLELLADEVLLQQYAELYGLEIYLNTAMQLSELFVPCREGLDGLFEALGQTKMASNEELPGRIVEKDGGHWLEGYDRRPLYDRELQALKHGFSKRGDKTKAERLIEISSEIDEIMRNPSLTPDQVERIRALKAEFADIVGPGSTAAAWQDAARLGRLSDKAPGEE